MLGSYERARTAHCRAPGCGARTITSEIDHTIPHPAGANCQRNVQDRPCLAGVDEKALTCLKFSEAPPRPLAASTGDALAFSPLILFSLKIGGRITDRI